MNISKNITRTIYNFSSPTYINYTRETAVSQVFQVAFYSGAQ